MMGKATHAAMFHYGHAFMAQTGEHTWNAEVTTHHVEKGIDTGDVIAQSAVTLRREDGLEPFIERVLHAEHRLQIEVLKHLGTHDAFPSFTRTKPLIPSEMRHLLTQARELAMREFPHVSHG